MNHARDNWYQPGALIAWGTKSLPGSDTTYSTTGSWRDIQDASANTLTLSYTPPVDAVIALLLRARFRTDTASRSLELHFWNGSNEWAYGRFYFVTTNAGHTLSLLALASLSAGVAYTIQSRYRLPSGESQTVTTYAAFPNTALHYAVFRVP